ncbi:MAG TPA: hypothetical protein VGJ07_00525 [Rugosimonospora sp.]|jgi:hypothetical protein
MRRVAPAILLFFLAPLVAEFLLGDFTVEYLFFLILLAPMYGGGAILIREVTRRTGRGWPSIVLLGLAYGVFEEGITTQSLFDPNYADAHLLAKGFIPALGIAVPWTLFVLALHTVWSISVPIALVEGLTPRRRTMPWLRTPGLVVAAVLFGIGSVATLAISYATDHFLAPRPALAVVLLVVVALAVTALRLPPAAVSAAPVGGTAPSAWVAFVGTLAAGAVVMVARELPTWVGVAAFVAVVVVAVVAVRIWSRRTGWGAPHRLALAGGALLTYAWHGFLMRPVEGGGSVITPVSHAVFGLAALGLLALELRALRAPADPAHGPAAVPDATAAAA